MAVEDTLFQVPLKGPLSLLDSGASGAWSRLATPFAWVYPWCSSQRSPSIIGSVVYWNSSPVLEISAGPKVVDAKPFYTGMDDVIVCVRSMYLALLSD